MSTAERAPADPAERAAWQRARRQVARQHHPDVGGDVDEYLRQLADVDRRHGVLPAGAGARPITVRHRRGAGPVRATRRRWRRVVRTVRSRLPAAVPGARRYIDL